VVRPLRDQGEHHGRAHGNDRERQRLLDQVRLALALPGPPRQDVADRRPGHPRGDRRLAGGQVPRAQADRENDLACDDRGGRDQHESAEPLTDRGLEPAFHGRGDPGRSDCHEASLSCARLARQHPGRQRLAGRPGRRERAATGLRILVTLSRLSRYCSESAPLTAELSLPYPAKGTRSCGDYSRSTVTLRNHLVTSSRRPSTCRRRPRAHR
jgi:hypothetical protein